MFELEILLSNVVAPLAIVLIGYKAIPPEYRTRIASFVLALCSGLAIWAALAIRNGFAWWPEDAWQKVPVAAMIITAVAMIAELLRSTSVCTERISTEEASSTTRLSPVRVSSGRVSSGRVSPVRSRTDLIHCAAVAISAVVATWLIYPRGEAWAELQDQEYQWWAVITLAASFGWWGIAGCQPRVASTVGLATIPLLIASAFMTALSIMKVTEPLIAIATVFGLCSLIDLQLPGRRSLPMMFAPTLFAMSGFIAHASFQSYLNLPRTLYFLAMLSPVIVALVARMAQRKSTQFAIGLTILLSLSMAVAIGTWAYVAGEVGSAGEW